MVSTISSLGVGSGLDAESIVRQLMALERRSLTALETRTQGVEAKISAFGSIKSLIDNFAASAGKFKTLNGFAGFKATSTNSEKLGASANATATAGSYDVVVKKLARAEKTAVSIPNATATTPIGAGQLNIKVGTGNAVNVEVTSATATLGDWRDAINRSNADVTATIVYGASTAELIFTAKETGKPITISTGVTELTPSVPGTPTALSGAFATVAEVPYIAPVTGQPQKQSIALGAPDGTIGNTTVGAGVLTIAGTAVELTDVNASANDWVNAINTTPALTGLVSASLDAATGRLVLTAGANGQSFAAVATALPSGLTGTFNDTTPPGQSAIAPVAEQLGVNEKRTLDFVGDLNTVVGAGKLGIAINGGAETDITLGANATLQDWITAINTGGAGVAATFEGGKLVLTANGPGQSIAVNNSIATVPATFSPSQAPPLLSGTYTVKQAGQLAEMTIDGVTVTSESNTVTSAIPGMTLNLLKTSDPDPINITVARDTSATVEALNKFVSDFNALNARIKNLTAYDSANNRANTLTGDATVRTLQSMLTNVFNSALIPADPGNDKKLLNLPSIGLTFQRDGGLALNTTKLQELMSQDFEGVANVLMAYSTRLTDRTTSMTQTGGMFSAKTESLRLMIKDFGNREEALNLRLEAIEKRYRAQFSGLDTLVASMQQTSTFLTQQIGRLG